MLRLNVILWYIYTLYGTSSYKEAEHQEQNENLSLKYIYKKSQCEQFT